MVNEEKENGTLESIAGKTRSIKQMSDEDREQKYIQTMESHHKKLEDFMVEAQQDLFDAALPFVLADFDEQVEKEPAWMRCFDIAGTHLHESKNKARKRFYDLLAELNGK